jgi:ankyrin repeat protein
VDLQSNKGWTALMIAVEKGHKDIVDALVAHNCKLDLQDNDGYNALIIAANIGHKDVVDALISYRWYDLDVQDNNGETALMFAAENGHKDIVDVLISHKCDLNLKNKNGKTALMIAKSNNHVEVVALIENQLRRNRNWDHRKALMLVLAGSKYLPSSSSLLSSASSSSAVNAGRGTGRVVQTPVVIPRVDVALTSSEKVLCDLFLVQHIMRYI